MSWEYSQSSGIVTYNGVFVWVGYSGERMAVNNPVFESDPFQGPIPKGRYRMRLHASPGRAPPVFKLTPEGHNAFGRTDFLIHGDNQSQKFHGIGGLYHPAHQYSESDTSVQERSFGRDPVSYASAGCLRAGLLLFVATAACAAQKHSLTPALVLQEVRTHGAKKVVARLSKEVELPSGTEGFRQFAAPLWDEVIEQIETGDPQWLAVAQALRPGTDAGSAEALMITISQALPNAPANVLRIVNTDAHDQRSFNIERVCSASLIEPLSGVQESLLQRSEAALLALRVPELEGKRQACLQHIQASQNRLVQINEQELRRRKELMATASSGPLVPAPLLQEIKTHGARHVVARLWLWTRTELPVKTQGPPQFEETHEWDQALAHIQTGDVQWLNVAQALEPGTDAASSAQLSNAVMLALPSATVNVLRMLRANDPGVTLESVCSVIPMAPQLDIQQVLLRNEAALLDLRVPELDDKRQSCLKHMQEAKKRFREYESRRLAAPQVP